MQVAMIILSIHRYTIEHFTKATKLMFYRNSSDGTNPRYKILFFGSDTFSLPSLNALYSGLKLVQTTGFLELVTSIKASKNPLLKFALQKGIPIHDWPLKCNNVGNNFDLGVIVSFGHLIPETVINSFHLGIINVHASILPKLRGAAPITHAIAQGESVTGISIMRIKPKHFDIGEILLQHSISVKPNMLLPQLHSQLSTLGATGLVECIKNIDFFYEHCVEQNKADISFAPKINREFAEVLWDKMNGKQIYDRFRSLYSYRPLRTVLNGELVKIFAISFDHYQPCTDTTKDPGHIEYSKSSKQLKVWTSDGTFVLISRLSVSGKKVITGEEFYNGYIGKLESNLRYFGFRKQ